MNDWIPVNDRLPSYAECSCRYVLVLWCGKPFVATYNNLDHLEEGAYAFQFYAKVTNGGPSDGQVLRHTVFSGGREPVTHWLPIPQPPTSLTVNSYICEA